MLSENKELKQLLNRTLDMCKHNQGKLEKLTQENITQKLRLTAEKTSLHQELTADKDRYENDLAAICTRLSEMEQREYPLETDVHNMITESAQSRRDTITDTTRVFSEW